MLFTYLNVEFVSTVFVIHCMGSGVGNWIIRCNSGCNQRISMYTKYMQETNSNISP